MASPSHWQKLQSFIRSNRISFVWLGGTDEVNEGNWTWTDGSKWSVEHWAHRMVGGWEGTGGSGQNSLTCNEWDDGGMGGWFLMWYPSAACQPFTSENISTTPAIQPESGGWHNEAVKVIRIDNWELCRKKRSWKKRVFPRYNYVKRDLKIMALLNIVHESKVYSIGEDKVWKTLLQHRWDVRILKTNPVLMMDKSWRWFTKLDKIWTS